MEAAARDGLDGVAGGTPLRTLASELVAFASSALGGGSTACDRASRGQNALAALAGALGLPVPERP
jgi:hypothetical protein